MNENLLHRWKQKIVVDGDDKQVEVRNAASIIVGQYRYDGHGTG